MKHIIFALVIFQATTAAAPDEISLPVPTGPYAVGTTRRLLVDEASPELFTEEDDRREVTVRAWYPADAEAEGATAPYYDDAGQVVNRFGYLSALAGLETHSRFDVPVSPQQDAYPVILFNHGWGEHALQNTALMEELASNGYVVFSLAHHHEAKFWVYPDGRIAFLNTWAPRFIKIMTEQNQPEMMPLFEAMFRTRGLLVRSPFSGVLLRLCRPCWWRVRGCVRQT